MPKHTTSDVEKRALHVAEHVAEQKYRRRDDSDYFRILIDTYDETAFMLGGGLPPHSVLTKELL